MHPTATRLKQAQEAADKARESRDEAIRASLAEGKTLRQVGEEFGVYASFVQKVRDRGR